MATKAKDSSVVGKDKKAPSSNSPSPITTKKTTKPSTPDKGIPNPSEKQVPNYLKPTISSRLDSNSHSFKLPKSDASNNKPTLNRRRSFDKPPSPSRLLSKQKQPSPSRQHKALVSPGPRDRVLLHRSSTLPVKSTTNPPKPISEKISKTPKEGKTQPLIAKTTKKSTSHSLSTSTTKKLANDASANSKNANKSTVEAKEVIKVETEPEVKEDVKEEIGEVEKVEDINQEHEVEDVSETEIPHHVDSEVEHDDHEHDHELDVSDQPQIQADDNEKVIPPVSEEEEVAKDEHEEVEGENTNQQDECNINENHQEINHSISTKEEVEVVKEKEEEKEEGGVVIEEDHKNETNNEEEEEVVDLEKEGVEGGTSEGEVKEVKLTKGEDEEELVESEVKEDNVESTKPKQQASTSGVHGKKESQRSNDVIEETASKLLEERKNKVRALAGAFQTVIDHQTK